MTINRRRSLSMKKITILTLLVAMLIITGTVAATPGHGNFRAHLNGGAEVPPVATVSQGQAIFNVDRGMSPTPCQPV
jgi:hypothetical protein